MAQRIAVVMSDIFLRRLSPSLTRLARDGALFRILDIARPPEEISAFLSENRPRVLLTEWLPRITNRLLRLRLPTVCIGDVGEVYPRSIRIDVDDFMIGSNAAAYFLRAGYRNFAFAGLDRPYSDERQRGFEARLRKNKLTCDVFLEKESSRHHYMEIWKGPSSRMCAWLESQPKPLAVFAAHDPLGRQICEAANESRDLSVPQLISVLGANDDPLVCPLSRPPLSSIEIPWNRIGEAACDAIELLLSSRQSKPKTFLFQPGPVIERQSTTLLAVDDPVLRRAIAYLRQHFTEPINVNSVCAELRMSRRTVERRFTEHLGCTPLVLLHQLRVDLAKKLLLSTVLPISRIAEECGFSDGERFALVFKQLSGGTPSAFRKASPRAVLP